jgi:hypothetical protein
MLVIRFGLWQMNFRKNLEYLLQWSVDIEVLPIKKDFGILDDAQIHSAPPQDIANINLALLLIYLMRVLKRIFNPILHIVGIYLGFKPMLIFMGGLKAIKNEYKLMNMRLSHGIIAILGLLLQLVFIILVGPSQNL